MLQFTVYIVSLKNVYHTAFCRRQCTCFLPGMYPYRLAGYSRVRLDPECPRIAAGAHIISCVQEYKKTGHVGFAVCPGLIGISGISYKCLSCAHEGSSLPVVYCRAVKQPVFKYPFDRRGYFFAFVNSVGKHAGYTDPGQTHIPYCILCRNALF